MLMPRRSWPRFFITLWKFSRPHTIIGSLFSISALFLMASNESPAWNAARFELGTLTLLACLACNVFITGLNQWADVELDRINKPGLPIPAGLLSRRAALRICLISLALALGIAASLSAYFFLLIALISLIGALYSLPPVKFKRHHLGAASAISLVRGLLVNLGIFWHFHREMAGNAPLPSFLWPITAFIFVFSLAIAWFKDIPDSAGDAVFQIKTVAVRYSREAALKLGLWLVAMAYAAVACCFFYGYLTPEVPWMAVAHVICGALFLFYGYRLDARNNTQIHRFYMFFWGLFFLEYILYPLGVGWPDF